MEKEVFNNRIVKFIKLFSLYLNKKKAADFVVDNNELSFFIKMANRHSLTALLFKVLQDTNSKVEEGVLKKLEEHYFLVLRKAILFDKERKELYDYLNTNQIDYLPLKGIILKDYYFDPYTREFADNDILFDGSKDKLVKDFFTNKDYIVELFRKSNHDVYIKKPFYNFEMHRALFGETGDNKKNIVYFKDYLSKAHIKENYEHELGKEDFYIYFTAHTYKHFHVSGCGIRTLIDYYLFSKNNSDLDFAYINQELEKLDLLDFSNQIKTLAIKLFDDEPIDEKETEMLLYIASSGTYGTVDHYVAKGVKAKGKFGFLMSRVFPPYSFYKSAYPWAYKCPILIPAAWLWRFFRILFKSPGRAMGEIKLISKCKEDKND